MAMPMAASRQVAAYDLVIVGARIADGTGAPARAADIALKDGLIAAIGNLSLALARERLDARGLVVAPGFIDVHTHADELAGRPHAENFVRMGVTTSSPATAARRRLPSARPSAASERRPRRSTSRHSSVQHGSHCSDGQLARDPSLDELGRMKALVFTAMVDGAVGFSTGLQYVPGTYSKSNEIIELARVAANEGGLYATHMRNEGTALEAAVRESLNVARTLDMRLQISHLKSIARAVGAQRGRAETHRRRAGERAQRAGRPVRLYGRFVVALDPISVVGARRRQRAYSRAPRRSGHMGEDEEGDCRVAGRSGLHGPFVGDGGELSAGSVDQRIVDERRGAEARRRRHARRADRSRPAADAWWRRVNGLSLHGRRRHRADHAPPDGLVRLGCRRDRAWRRRAASSRLRQRCSRAWRVRPGPQSDLARGRCAEDDVAAGTHFGFAGRGIIAEGAAADLVLFDAARVRDLATYDKPHAYAEGIRTFWSTAFVVRDGKTTGERPGRVLRRERR